MWKGVEESSVVELWAPKKEAVGCCEESRIWTRVCSGEEEEVS